jgi:hypothetical protein
MDKKAIAVAIGTLFVIVTLVPGGNSAPAPGTGSTSGLTQEEVAILADLDYTAAWNDLAYLAGLGEKVAGTQAEKDAQQYVYDRLSAMPLDKVVMETFPVAAWDHHGTTMVIVTNGNEAVPITTYGDSYSIWGYENHVMYTFGNENGGMTLVAPVVDCGLGTMDEFDAIGDLGGAIALIHRDDNIQGWNNVPAFEASLHGASAALFYGYFAGADLPEGIKQDSVGGPIPILSISPNSASHIKDLMSGGQVVLKVDGRVDMLSERFAESVNVAAYLYGTTKPDEYVVISGHIDCWWFGANDDSSSIAAMLEFARLFSEARAAGTFVNERTLVFCSVGAEEEGGPQGTWYNWLVGSYEFVQAHPEIMKGLAVELNMDGCSFAKTTGRYWIENTWELNSFVYKTTVDLGISGQVGYYNPIWSWTDAWSFGAKGGGSTVNILWGSGFDPYYHTQIDDMPLQSPSALNLVLDVYTLMAIRMAHLLVLPMEFQNTVDWSASYLKSEKMTVPSEAKNIQKDLDALAVLRAQAVAANSYAASLNAQYAAAKNPGQKAVVAAKADALNDVLIEARRVITPWTLGEGGLMGSWDVFLRSDQHAQDLGFVNSAIDALNRGRTSNAMAALGNVYSMEWGKYFSRGAYLDTFNNMQNAFMYWGDDFDQQQAYVDVHWIYLGLKDGSVSNQAALNALKSIRDGQLIPWFEADLSVQAWAWTQSAGILDAGVP